VQAAEALESAPSLGIVHRAVKPGSLMIDDAGKLRVTDLPPPAKK
jgi:serine/threonine protein kinase